MKQENSILREIQVEASSLGARVFRNNRGMFLSLDGKRKIRAGLDTDGASDLIGLTPVFITQEMVGKKIAVFTAIEVKKPSASLKTATALAQAKFIEFVKMNGGFAGFCNDKNFLKKLLRND